MANARGLSEGNRETREAEMLFHSLFILLIVVNNTLSTRIYIFLCDYLAVIWKNSTKRNSYEDNSGLVNSFVLCYHKKIFMKCESLEWKKNIDVEDQRKVIEDCFHPNSKIIHSLKTGHLKTYPYVQILLV